MVADVTVTRLAEDLFRVVTGAGFVANDLAWLKANRTGDDESEIDIREVSAELATIGLWGPRAREILAATTPDNVGDVALPIRRAVEIAVAESPVVAARISYAGELGWELTTPREHAVAVWDALSRAGAEHGLAPIGYRALDGLRMEKGYRYYGVDMTMLETPFEAGLGPFVRLTKGPFMGRDALLASRDAGALARRLVTILIGGAEYEPVYGGEAVRADGEVIGRLRSVAYGPSVARTIGYVYLPTTLRADASLEVDVFDERAGAVIAPDVPVDPAGDRMRG
jgi:4-methylaminobutanoate oxidase (formaldehyde-forming)